MNLMKENNSKNIHSESNYSVVITFHLLSKVIDIHQNHRGWNQDRIVKHQVKLLHHFRGQDMK
jgi:hypothetical protein